MIETITPHEAVLRLRELDMNTSRLTGRTDD